jgi:dihydrofolate reductase
MGKVIVGTTMSLDGFISDRDGNVGRLYPDLAALAESDFFRESLKTTGAVLMGRRTYDMGQGDYTDYEYQLPIFVVTHTPPARAAKGENENLKFTFVTDGVASAVQKARAAAGDKDVMLVGGAALGQQLLKAGLADEIQIGIMPVLLGDGLRFFEHLETLQIELETVKVIQTGPRTDLICRIIR